MLWAPGKRTSYIQNGEKRTGKGLGPLLDQVVSPLNLGGFVWLIGANQLANGTGKLAVPKKYVRLTAGKEKKTVITDEQEEREDKGKIKYNGILERNQISDKGRFQKEEGHNLGLIPHKKDEG